MILCGYIYSTRCQVNRQKKFEIIDKENLAIDLYIINERGNRKHKRAKSLVNLCLYTLNLLGLLPFLLIKFRAQYLLSNNSVRYSMIHLSTKIFPLEHFMSFLFPLWDVFVSSLFST